MKCRALPTQRGLLLFLPLSGFVTTTLSNTGKLLCESALIQSLFCPPPRFAEELKRPGATAGWPGLFPERDDVTAETRCPRPTKQVFHKNFPRQFNSHPAAARTDTREPRERENPLTDDQQRNVTKS